MADSIFQKWTVDCGQWTVDCGLWTVDCGLWTVDIKNLLSNSPQSTVHCPLSTNRSVASHWHEHVEEAFLASDFQWGELLAELKRDIVRFHDLQWLKDIGVVE